MNSQIDPNKHLDKNQVFIDTKRESREFFDAFAKPDNVKLIIFSSSLLIIAFPSLLPFLLLVNLFFYLVCTRSRKNITAAENIPIYMDLMDPNNIDENNRPKKADADVFLGTEKKTNRQIWVNFSRYLLHFMLLGTTGAGKTQALLSMTISSSFIAGGGVIYIDGKAVADATYIMATIATIFGRIDDLRVLRFNTGNKIIRPGDYEKDSNTMNPFSKSSPTVINQLLIAMMPTSSSGSNGSQYFDSQAIAMIEVLSPILCEIRDANIAKIYPSLISEYISIAKLIELAYGEIVIKGKSYSDIYKLSEKSQTLARNFLRNLPGFKLNDLDKEVLEPIAVHASEIANNQAEEVRKQFGFIQGYYNKIFTSMLGTFAHIFEVENGEVDFIDCLINKRIIMALYPATELSNEEKKSLGTMNLSAIKVAFSSRLGDAIEGKRRDVVDALVEASKVPCIQILDEYAEIGSDGFAVAATQGRGLGVGSVFSAQEFAGILRAAEGDAHLILGSTRNKALMSIEDVEKTWPIFDKIFGQGYAAKRSGHEYNVETFNNYTNSSHLQIEKIDRVDFSEVNAQGQGEAIYHFQGKLLRVKMFYHNLGKKDIVEDLRINRLIQAPPPTPEKILQLKNAIKINVHLKKRTKEKNTLHVNSEKGSVLDIFKNKIEEINIEKMLSCSKKIERGVSKNENSSKPEAKVENNSSAQVAGKTVGAKTSPNNNEQPETSNDAKKSDNAIGKPAPHNYTERPNKILSGSESFSGFENPPNTSTPENPLIEPGSEIETLTAGMNQVISNDDNDWIFLLEGNNEQPQGSGKNSLYDDLCLINSLSSVGSDDSHDNVEKVIETFGSSVNYSNVAEQNMTNASPDDLWESLNKIKQAKEESQFQPT